LQFGSIAFPKIPGTERSSAMAVIDKGYLETIAEENQRLVDTAKSLWGLTSYIADPKASSQFQEQINRLLDISERISSSLGNAR
jgi:hypothetical protein